MYYVDAQLFLRVSWKCFARIMKMFCAYHENVLRVSWKCCAYHENVARIMKIFCAYDENVARMMKIFCAYDENILCVSWKYLARYEFYAGAQIIILQQI